MLRLILLSVAMMLIVSSTVTAQTIKPTRPVEKHEFPQAREYTIAGVVHKCFEKDGESWKAIGHIVVDYRAFFPWAIWAEKRIDEISTLQEQRDIWRNVSQSAEQALQVSTSAYAEEHKLRLSIQRRKSLTPWLMGGGLAIETILIVCLSIWGAAQ